MENENADPEPIYTLLSELGNKIIQEYIQKDILLASYKILTNSNIKSLYLTLLFKKCTELNKFMDDIFFTVTIPVNEKSEILCPILHCLSNFAYPSLFDNRNLLNCIIKEVPKIIPQEEISKYIDDIILGIPNFLNKVKENMSNKELIYYGEYQIDEIYELNDFLLNPENIFYKAIHYQKKSTERYIILTDIYFLLFDPSSTYQNLGKLVFIADLKQLVKKKFSKIKDQNTVIIEWIQETNNKKMTFELGFVNNNPNNFIIDIERKQNKLFDSYHYERDNKLWDNEEKKYREDLLKKELCLDDINSLKKKISDKEKIYRNNKTYEINFQLIMMYERAIDLISKLESNEANEMQLRLNVLLQDKKDIISNLEKQMFRVSRGFSEIEE